VSDHAGGNDVYLMYYFHRVSQAPFTDIDAPRRPAGSAREVTYFEWYHFLVGYS